jgi:hypothetical protein
LPRTQNPRLKRATTRFLERPSTLSAGTAALRLQGCFDALLRWALKGCESVAEIYEKCAFPRFPAFSVENVEEKICEKVIHSLLFLPSFHAPKTRQNGGSPNAGCPDKYLKTQCT